MFEEGKVTRRGSSFSAEKYPLSVLYFVEFCIGREVDLVKGARRFGDWVEFGFREVIRSFGWVEVY